MEICCAQCFTNWFWVQNSIGMFSILSAFFFYIPKLKKRKSNEQKKEVKEKYAMKKRRTFTITLGGRKSQKMNSKTENFYCATQSRSWEIVNAFVQSNSVAAIATVLIGFFFVCLLNEACRYVCAKINGRWRAWGKSLQATQRLDCTHAKHYILYTMKWITFKLSTAQLNDSNITQIGFEWYKSLKMMSINRNKQTALVAKPLLLWNESHSNVKFNFSWTVVGHRKT